jgi:hypothetical protein
MIKLPRLLQPSLIAILLISVFALASVAYTQYEEQQYWKSKYEDAVVQIPVTLSLSWFANSTDIDGTEFMDSLHRKIEPVKIEMPNYLEGVIFWFRKCDIGNGTILLHLPNQSEGSYNPIDVPFFDIRLCVPSSWWK